MFAADLQFPPGCPFSGALGMRALWPWELAEHKSKRPLYEITATIGFESAAFGRIEVLPGLVCDLASVPRATKAYLDSDAPQILAASIIHDYLYDLQGALPDGRQISRRHADEIFQEAMLASGARVTQAWLAFQAVRLFGGKHWRES